MDRRHPGSQDGSGDIHGSLDSSTPCWNDAIEEGVLGLTEVSLFPYFERSSPLFEIMIVADRFQNDSVLEGVRLSG